MSEPNKYRLLIEYDSMPEDPADDDFQMFTAHSFSVRHTNYLDPRTIDDDDTTLVAGLSYSEHGLCLWERSEISRSHVDHWDYVHTAGVLFVKSEYINTWDTFTDAERNKEIDEFLDDYTNYCNGSVYSIMLSAYATCASCGTDSEVVDSYYSDYSRSNLYAKDLQAVIAEFKGALDDLPVEIIDKTGVLD